jgi:phosphoribosylformylglycinamidine synthase
MPRIYRVEVTWHGGEDGRAVELLGRIAQLKVADVEGVRIDTLYFLRSASDDAAGDALTAADVQRIAEELLVDPVVEAYRWRPVAVTDTDDDDATDVGHVVEVSYRPGVTDPVAKHLLKRARLLGVEGLAAVTTGTRYTFDGDLTPEALHTIAQGVLCNDVIQTYALGPMRPAFVPEAAPSDAVELVPLRDLDDAALARLSRARVLSLSLPEMHAIQAKFRALDRDPTDVELETLAQTWSEHCLHKSFKAQIDYVCHGGMPRVLVDPDDPVAEPERRPCPTETTIPGLLKTYLRAATERLDRPWVRSAFVDNAGVVDFDATYEVAFKVETHNHPSALEPFGGANTGVGGVIRDVIGVSARPIAATDVLCFGPLDTPADRVPAGSLHPRRVARGVVAGIEDYGNKMGIPTVSGAILYHPDYVANPLVYCGCVGIAPKGAHPRDPQPGDRVVALGGRTGRDGLHGATFSSAELTHETGATVGSVVQIGDPITEKAVLDAVMQARDEGLYHAITDCGAGGFSSAVGEMGAEVGVAVDLQDVPLKYPGLRPWEIWLSEAQERMVLAVPSAHLPRLREICAVYDVEITDIGHFTGDRRLRVRYGDEVVADLPMDFVHAGWPRLTLRAVWGGESANGQMGKSVSKRSDKIETLLGMLAHPDAASKEDVIRRYDHEVQGGTIVKPLVGAAADGPSDAAVLKPLMTEGARGLALGAGINPAYGLGDPYAMAWAVVDEAVRNVVAVGADPDRVALLDNFCWGNPRLPDRLGGLVRAAQGCHDAALAYRTPFISGKDSLNNEFVDVQGEKRTIPPTLLISSLAPVPDVRRAITMDLKRAGNLLYVVGETRAELGRSLYQRLLGREGGALPAPVPDAIVTMRALHRAMRAGRVRACHDCAEGGIAVAAAEMCIAGRLGLDLALAPLPRAADVDDEAALFAESSARFLVEVPSAHTAAFEQTMRGCPVARLGRVTATPRLRVRGLTGEVCLDADVDALRRTWQLGPRF